MDEKDFEEKLYEELYDEFGNEEELNKYIDGIIANAKLEKTICMFWG